MLQQAASKGEHKEPQIIVQDETIPKQQPETMIVSVNKQLIKSDRACIEKNNTRGVVEQNCAKSLLLL